MIELINFEKYHGLGNDFIIFLKEDLDRLKIFEKNYSNLIKEVCERNTGLGADGGIVLKKIDKKNCQMIFFNQDGTKAPMCGNGIRCFSHYIFENKILEGNIYNIQTLAGELEVKIYNENSFKVKVNMGKPDFKLENIPLNKEIFNSLEKKVEKEYCLEIEEKKFKLTSLFMGTTHTVNFVQNLEELDISKYGEKIEKHELYPKKTNVNFVEILDKKNIAMKTWERGAGLTLACGTGATASVVVGIEKGCLEKKVNVHLSKGVLEIELDKSGEIFMTGPSKKIAKGVWEYEKN